MHQLYAVGNLRSEDYTLLIKSQLIGAPVGYWIGEQCSIKAGEAVAEAVPLATCHRPSTGS